MASDTELWQKFTEWLWAPLGGLLGVVWSQLTGKINDMKEGVSRLEERTISRTTFEDHMETDEKVQGQLREELQVHREHIARIFEQMRDIEGKAHERHIELLNAIHEGTPRRK